MTDFLIMGSNFISVVSLAQPIVCSIEVGGAGKYKTCEATAMKRWPEKVGELMASMYLFSTLNYLNQLTGTPQILKFEVYGVLAICGVGSLLLKMTLDSTDCCVSLLYEGEYWTWVIF